MTNLTFVRTHQISPQIKQSRIKRDWMDATYNKHAYRCLPLTSANVNGWEIILQQEVRVVWEGGQHVPKIIKGDTYKGRQIANCNKIGMIDFNVGWSFRTDPGYDLWISGSPNYFVDGAAPLTVSIPSHWWPDEIHFSWNLTSIGEEIIFPEGMPFMFLFVYKNDLLENTNVTVENLWDKPELMKERMSYGDAKMKKMQEQPWTWMNGIRTGLNEKGERIGPRHEGLPILNEPVIPEVPYYEA